MSPHVAQSSYKAAAEATRDKGTCCNLSHFDQPMKFLNDPRAFAESACAPYKMPANKQAFQTLMNVGT